jgi:hypothetical protein
MTAIERIVREATANGWEISWIAGRRVLVAPPEPIAEILVDGLDTPEIAERVARLRAGVEGGTVRSAPQHVVGKVGQ